VFNIQRFSLHDGPGIRSVVFFQGCHMRCAWCCNPESWAQARGASTQSAITLDAVRKEVARDVPYYLVSGGGVTLSGGEVMLQAPFARALLESLSAEGIHTAIETAGFAPWSVVKNVANNPTESVSLAYESITWLYLDGNISYTDSWNQRVVA